MEAVFSVRGKHEPAVFRNKRAGYPAILRFQFIYQSLSRLGARYWLKGRSPDFCALGAAIKIFQGQINDRRDVERQKWGRKKPPDQGDAQWFAHPGARAKT